MGDQRRSIMREVHIGLDVVGLNMQWCNASGLVSYWLDLLSRLEWYVGRPKLKPSQSETSTYLIHQ